MRPGLNKVFAIVCNFLIKVFSVYITHSNTAEEYVV